MALFYFRLRRYGYVLGEKKPQMLYRDVLWDNSKLELNVHSPIPAGYAENISMWGWPDEWPVGPGKETKASHYRSGFSRRLPT